MLETLGLAALVVFLYMCGFFIASLLRKDNSILDNVEWSGNRSARPSPKNSRNDRESAQRHSIPRSDSIPSK